MCEIEIHLHTHKCGGGPQYKVAEDSDADVGSGRAARGHADVVASRSIRNATGTFIITPAAVREVRHSCPLSLQHLHLRP